MTTTTFTPADLAARAVQLDRDAQAARATVAEQQAAADRMADQARAAAEAVHIAEQTARTEASRAYTTQMLTLTQQVQAARQAAIQAVQNGGDALGAWLAYRTLRAVNAGRWDALKNDFRRVVGSEPPPGNWGPHVAPGPLGVDGSAIVETFADFLTAACATHERDIRAASFIATSNELDAAHADQATVAQPKPKKQTAE